MDESEGGSVALNRTSEWSTYYTDTGVRSVSDFCPEFAVLINSAYLFINPPIIQFMIIFSINSFLSRKQENDDEFDYDDSVHNMCWYRGWDVKRRRSAG